VPVEIVPHRWDLLDTGEFTVVMGRRPGEIHFLEVHRRGVDDAAPADSDAQELVADYRPGRPAGSER